MQILEMKKRDLVEMTPRLLNELYRRTKTFEPFTISVSGVDCDISFYDGSEILSLYSYHDRFEVCSDDIFLQYTHKVLNNLCKEFLNITDDEFVVETSDDEFNSFIIYNTEERAFQESVVNDNVLDYNTYEQIVLLHRNVHEFIGNRWLSSGGINVRI